VKLNLLRLCSEKTIFKLFIHEITEYQLSLDLLYDLLFCRFFCKQNGIQFTDTAILLVHVCPMRCSNY